MTLSPDDDRRVIARPDLPAYPLNQTCPRYNALPAVENHHLWRRSTGSGFAEAYWVELSDGTILPNRIMLSNQAHREITENRAHIKWLGRYERFAWLFKNERDDWEFYRPINEFLPHVTQVDPEFNPDYVMGPDDEVPRLATPAERESIGLPPSPPHAHVSEGEECPTCHRRIPHAKKPSSPKTKVSSYRCPVDDAGTHDELAAAAAHQLGIHSKPHWRWALNTYGYGLILQGARLEERGA